MISIIFYQLLLTVDFENTAVTKIVVITEYYIVLPPDIWYHYIHYRRPSVFYVDLRK